MKTIATSQLNEQMDLIRILRNLNEDTKRSENLWGNRMNAEKCRFKAAVFGQGTRHIKNIIYWQRIQ